LGRSSGVSPLAANGASNRDGRVNTDSPPELTERDRLRGHVVTWSFALLVLLPVLLQASDSFPLSTYPMFARPRGKPFIYQLVALTPDDRSTILPPSYVGSSESLQAKVLIQRAAKSGRAARRELCRSVAHRVRELGAPAGATEVQLVKVRFDPIAYFMESPEPMSRSVLVRCRVSREGAQ